MKNGFILGLRPHLIVGAAVGQGLCKAVASASGDEPEAFTGYLGYQQWGAGKLDRKCNQPRPTGTHENKPESVYLYCPQPC